MKYMVYSLARLLLLVIIPNNGLARVSLHNGEDQQGQKKQRNKQLLIGVVCCAVLASASAQQTTANATFIEDRPTMLFSGVLADADTFLVVGVAAGVPSNTPKGIIGKIDNQIQFGYYKVLGDSINVSYGLFWNSLIKSNDNRFVFSGYCNDSTYSALVGFADEKLDTILVFRYYSTSTDGFQVYNVLQYDDNNYYLAGGIALGNNVDVVLLKIDQTGMQLLEKKYHQFAYDYGESLIKLNNGNLLLGAVRNNNNQTLQKSNTWLLEVDTGGNVVRQWFDPNDSTYVAEGLRQTQDGGFIYGAQKKSYQTVNDVYKTSTIVKLDSNFDEQWVFEGGLIGNHTGFRDIEITNNGQYIACGNYSNKEAWIVKLDSDGVVIWDRKYVGLPDTFPTWNILTDIDIQPDGGLIAVGQCQRLINPDNLPPQVGWFLKLDSNGCEIENCLLSSPLTPEGGTAMQIYPNPTNGRFQVKLPEGMQGAVLSVYDVAGKVLLSQEAKEEQIHIDVSAFGKGLYFVTAQKGERILSTKLVIE